LSQEGITEGRSWSMRRPEAEGRAEGEEVVAEVAADVHEEGLRSGYWGVQEVRGDGVDVGGEPGGAAEAVAAHVVVELGGEGGVGEEVAQSLDFISSVDLPAHMIDLGHTPHMHGVQ